MPAQNIIAYVTTCQACALAVECDKDAKTSAIQAVTSCEDEGHGHSLSLYGEIDAPGTTHLTPAEKCHFCGSDLVNWIFAEWSGGTFLDRREKITCTKAGQGITAP